MTAESTVTMTRPCPACGREIAWTGAVAPLGGTSWRITCPCDTASSDNKGEPE